MMIASPAQSWQPQQPSSPLHGRAHLFFFMPSVGMWCSDTQKIKSAQPTPQTINSMNSAWTTKSRDIWVTILPHWMIFFWRRYLGSWGPLWIYFPLISTKDVAPDRTIPEKAWAMHQNSFMWRNWENWAISFVSKVSIPAPKDCVSFHILIGQLETNILALPIILVQIYYFSNQQ